MTIYRTHHTPAGLRLALRLSLGLIVLLLAERAAQHSWGEPGAAAIDSEPSAAEAPSAIGAGTQQPRFSADENQTPADKQARLREGTQLSNVVGRFKVSGDRATFIVNDTGQRFGGLENLNMARIVNIIRDDPDADWSVSGLVTEYQSSNYVLISKAIRKTKESKGLTKGIENAPHEVKVEDLGSENELPEAVQ